VDLPGQRHHERDHRGDREEPELAAVAGVQDQLTDRATRPAAGDQQGEAGDHRPAEAEQQPVRSGHVGGRVGGVRRVAAGRVREVEVDRVLGQHSDQRQQRGRQSAGDIHLGGLRGPGQHERRGHDAGAVHDQGDRRRRMDASEADEDGWERDGEAHQRRSKRLQHMVNGCILSQSTKHQTVVGCGRSRDVGWTQQRQ
jgi:hypothetical protein